MITEASMSAAEAADQRFLRVLLRHRVRQARLDADPALQQAEVARGERALHEADDLAEGRLGRDREDREVPRAAPPRAGRTGTARKITPTPKPMAVRPASAASTTSARWVAASPRSLSPVVSSTQLVSSQRVGFAISIAWAPATGRRRHAGDAATSSRPKLRLRDEIAERQRHGERTVSHALVIP